MSDKKNYLLLHGAWHTSRCWEKIIPLLKAQGHEVYAPDLPGHGELVSCVGITLETYVSYVIDWVAKQSQPVVLVGHSFAGVIISQVAERIPELIEKLIYVTAFVPENKSSLAQEAGQSSSTGLSTAMEADYKNNITRLNKTDALKKLLFNCCNDTDADEALELLCAEPFQPFMDTINITEERFWKVNKLYVECLEDLTLPIVDQRRMHKKLACDVMSLQADHSPFLSSPYELARALLYDKNDLDLKAVKLIPATKDDYSIIKNMASFYAYDISKYMGHEKGWEFEDDGTYGTPQTLHLYWEEINRYPFIIRVNDELAGFVLINKIGSVPDTDWNMGEFFIAGKFQKKGLGQYIAHQIFDKFNGVWEVMVIPGNEGAYRFWRSAIKRYTKGYFKEYTRAVQYKRDEKRNIFNFRSG